MSSKSKKEVFKKGDRVSARWAGSNVYYDAKVLDVTSRTYRVQFDDGSVSSVKFSEAKKLSSKESSPRASKSKSRSRSRSTGRTTRSRSRSPARREKKATSSKNEKKSSTKEDKKKAESSNSNSVSVSKEEKDKPILTREKIGLIKSDTYEASKSPSIVVNSYSKEMSITMEKYEGTSERLRSTRLAALRSAELPRDTVDSKPLLESRNAKTSDKAKYSDDEEEEEEEEEVVVIPSLSKTWKTIYFLATVIRVILIPVSLICLVIVCPRKSCQLEPLMLFRKWSDILHIVKYPFVGVAAYHILHCVLSLIPFGKKVTGFANEVDKKPLEYRLNGLLILLLNIIVFSLCFYFGLNMNWGFDKSRGIAFSCAFYCILWAIGLHIYSLVKGDGTAQTKVPILGKFYNGSYSNPVLFGKLDLKSSFIRFGLMGLVILNLSILSKFILSKTFFPIPMALTSGMQLFFVFDLFAREEKLLSTATYTSDTFGYAFILTTGFLIPVGLALQNVYHYSCDAKTNAIPHYELAAMLLLFFIGYYIYLTSTNLKHNFRKNPFSPTLANVTSIPTSKKKRLISSGLWGKVRHPNYVGLLIMAIAWTLPCGFSHALPYGPLILLTIALIIRSFRIEAECKEKYGPAWANYTEKVRSRFIPYIF
ncbi:delta(14)-sterol reductase LBR [Trichonephila clavata]|uniref:Delta(14)-sterol reductase LBR n=1 Tax=Trichonephila clavata TaxID=2740835 RepID=A0A8X6FW54_TRICU|nr:delta(14)-sterol reductase LBR [Trichonephila clavata]